MTVINLGWTTPPLSGNRGRTNVHIYAALVRRAQGEARAAIRRAKPAAMVGADITLHYRVADRRRRDADNLLSTLKVVSDALVQEGIVPDDSWVHVPSATCRIHPPSDDGPALWVELTEPERLP